MNQGKKRVSCVLLFSLATLLMFGWAGATYAQSYQVVTLTSTPELVAQGGTVDVTFTYNTSDNRDDLTGFGAMLCFDSSALTYQSYTGIKAENLLSLPSVKVYDDTNDQCGFGATGKKIPLVYKEKDGVKFTSAGLPADLMKFTFQAANADITTTVKSIGTIKAAGYEIQDGTATITIGVPPTVAIPKTVVEADDADFWGTTDLKIIDVATADAYAAGRITGAQAKADVDFTTLAKETPILVYCREAANAKAEADALVADGFTKVYYLNDTFDNWVAAVNTTKVEYKLTITIAGTGTGTVTVDGTAYADAMWIVKDTTVVIVATPETGSIFDGFSIDTPDTAGNLTMNASKNVTATFSPDTCDAVAAITATPRTGAESLTVDFDSAGSTGTNPTWDYGDGETFQGATATHAYNAAGTYTVKLTMTGTGGCTHVATQDVTVTDQTCDAKAAFTATVNDLTATFDTTGSAGTLSFDYGDGSAAGTATTHTYASAGTYTVTLTATGTGGCTDTATQTVTLQGPCDAVAALTIVSVNELQVTFDTPNAVGDIMFDYGDGTTGVGYAHTYASAGTYTVTVTATGTGGCTDTASQSVTIPSSETPDGDGNGDGYTDIYDALLAAMYDVDIIQEADIARFAHLDVVDRGVADNRGKVVNLNDALAIAKKDVGKTCDCLLDEQ